MIINQVTLVNVGGEASCRRVATASMRSGRSSRTQGSGSVHHQRLSRALNNLNRVGTDASKFGSTPAKDENQVSRIALQQELDLKKGELELAVAENESQKKTIRELRGRVSSANVGTEDASFLRIQLGEKTDELTTLQQRLAQIEKYKDRVTSANAIAAKYEVAVADVQKAYDGVQLESDANGFLYNTLAGLLKDFTIAIKMAQLNKAGEYDSKTMGLWYETFEGELDSLGVHKAVLHTYSTARSIMNALLVHPQELATDEDVIKTLYAAADWENGGGISALIECKNRSCEGVESSVGGDSVSERSYDFSGPQATSGNRAMKTPNAKVRPEEMRSPISYFSPNRAIFDGDGMVYPTQLITDLSQLLEGTKPQYLRSGDEDQHVSISDIPNLLSRPFPFPVESNPNVEKYVTAVNQLKVQLGHMVSTVHDASLILTNVGELIVGPSLSRSMDTWQEFIETPLEISEKESPVVSDLLSVANDIKLKLKSTYDQVRLEPGTKSLSSALMDESRKTSQLRRDYDQLTTSNDGTSLEEVKSLKKKIAELEDRVEIDRQKIASNSHELIEVKGTLATLDAEKRSLVSEVGYFKNHVSRLEDRRRAEAMDNEQSVRTLTETLRGPTSPVIQALLRRQAFFKNLPISSPKPSPDISSIHMEFDIAEADKFRFPGGPDSVRKDSVMLMLEFFCSDGDSSFFDRTDVIELSPREFVMSAFYGADIPSRGSAHVRPATIRTALSTIAASGNRDFTCQELIEMLTDTTAPLTSSVGVPSGNGGLNGSNTKPHGSSKFIGTPGKTNSAARKK